MNDSPYSNREIDTHFAEVKEYLQRIEAQTTRTNGRVTKLESWKSLLIGGWSIVLFFVIPLVIAWAELRTESLEQTLIEHENHDAKNWEYVFKKLE
jgi:hypothetical protein